jgi:hypothetical protein
LTAYGFDDIAPEREKGRFKFLRALVGRTKSDGRMATRDRMIESRAVNATAEITIMVEPS